MQFHLVANRRLRLLSNQAIDTFAVSVRCRYKGFSLLVLAEGQHVEAVPGNGDVADDFASLFVVMQSPQFARDVITVEIVPSEFRQLRASINVAAGDGFSNPVIVLPHRIDAGDVDRGFVISKSERTFSGTPAVVSALLNNVDFFPQILPDVCQPE